MNKWALTPAAAKQAHLTYNHNNKWLGDEIYLLLNGDLIQNRLDNNYISLSK